MMAFTDQYSSRCHSVHPVSLAHGPPPSRNLSGSHYSQLLNHHVDFVISSRLSSQLHHYVTSDKSVYRSEAVFPSVKWEEYHLLCRVAVHMQSNKCKRTHIVPGTQQAYSKGEFVEMCLMPLLIGSVD